MSNQEYLDFIAAVARMEQEYCVSEKKAREFLRREGAIDDEGRLIPVEDREPA